MSDLQRSRSLKRPALSQSGRPKRVSMPNSFTNAVTASPSQLTADMATSSSYLGSSFTNAYIGGSMPLGGLAMVQNPSHMSQASYQLSAPGSPPSPLGLAFPQRQQYSGDSQASPLLDDSNMLSPADFLESRSYGNNRSAFLPGQGQYLDAVYAPFGGSDLPEFNDQNYQPALTTASSSFDPSMGILEELPSHINLDAPAMVHIRSQNSLGDALLGLPMDISNSTIKPDTPAYGWVGGNVSLHMDIPNQWSEYTFTSNLERTMTVESKHEPAYGSLPRHGLNQAKVDNVIDEEFDQVHCAPLMERNGSSNRNLSQRMRVREAATRHLSNAGKNNILPKDAPYASRATHAAMAGSVAHRSSAPKAGSSCSGKMEISKARRERPLHKRLYCPDCPDDTKGFRGPHELSRHNLRHHNAQRKRYICVDPRDNGAADAAQTSFTVYKSLSSCKKCSSGKQYGADYNAAAHLRRTHFKPHVPRSKGRAPPAQDDTSSLPVMEDLKGWIVEVTFQDSSQPSQSPVSDANTQPLGSFGSDSFFDEADELDDDQQKHMLELDFPPSHDQYILGANQDDALSAMPRGMHNDNMFTFDEDLDYNQLSQDDLHDQQLDELHGSSF